MISSELATTPDSAIIEVKNQGMNQVQGAAGIGAKAYDIAGVRWYLGLVKHNMKHLKNL